MTEDKNILQIEFQPVGKRVSAQEGETLLDAARRAGIDLHTACGGEGNCGQCRVQLMTGLLSGLTPDEEFFLSDSEIAEGYRLACCARVQGDVKIHLPRESVISGQRLQLESHIHDIAVEPFITACEVAVEPATLQDVRSDFTRVQDALRNAHRHIDEIAHFAHSHTDDKPPGAHSQIEEIPSFTHGQSDEIPSVTPGQPSFWAQARVARSLPALLRKHNWRLSVFLQDAEIIGFCPPGSKPLGLAVDLGTTKIAATLVELASGKVVASAGAPNPQISYGEDLISRLNLAGRDPQGGQLLANKVRSTINQLAGEMAQQANARRDQIAQACIVGNTAMTHLLLQLPVQQLASAPYVSACSDPMDVLAAELDLEMAPGARVHVPATIGGFVGADHVAMILGADIDRSDKVTIGVDIGTNTEVCLRVPGMAHMVSVSCASGPAFEGAHIRDGMRAASGAIEKMRIANDGVELVTIDHEPPVGICGSGIVDAMAELYANGLINRNGRFHREHKDVRQREHGWEFVLAPAAVSGSGRDIVVTQEDVNEIQLAKGAIQAGINILLEHSGIAPEAVQEVIIAGAFGSFLNIDNSIKIGLLPDFPQAAYRQVGNAAAVGARWMLISRAARARAAQIGRVTRYLELTTYPRFCRSFAKAMYFPKLNH